MLLEEADKQLTSEHRTLINTVGENEIVVKNRLPNITDKPYAAFYVIAPTKPIAFNGRLLGEYSNLEEMKGDFANQPFASDIDPNGWGVSPENW
jgi:hypothetical protein